MLTKHDLKKQSAVLFFVFVQVAKRRRLLACAQELCATPILARRCLNRRPCIDAGSSCAVGRICHKHSSPPLSPPNCSTSDDETPRAADNAYTYERASTPISQIICDLRENLLLALKAEGRNPGLRPRHLF